MDSSKSLGVGVHSSLIDLKSELLRKQEELKEAKLKEVNKKLKSVTRTEIANQKSVYAKSNKGVGERSSRDKETSYTADPDTIEAEKKSRTILEAKALVYEKLQKQAKTLGSCPDDEIMSVSLVDFERKALEDSEDDVQNEYKEDEDEWTEYTDAFGRTRRCLKVDLPAFIERDKEMNIGTKGSVLPKDGDEDEYKEKMREKWESIETKNLDKANIHYQDVQFDEVRTHGVGYFPFSTEQSQRSDQISHLKNMSKETDSARKQTAEEKRDKMKSMKSRLKKIKMRKRLRQGLPVNEDDFKDSDDEKETTTAASKPKESVDDSDEEDSETSKRAEMSIQIMNKLLKQDGQRTQSHPVRPWDVGKPSVDSNKKDIAHSYLSNWKRPSSTNEELDAQWVTKRRDERNREFAPKYDSESTRYKSKSCDKNEDSSHGVAIPPPSTYDYYNGRSAPPPRTVPNIDMGKSIEIGLRKIRSEFDRKTTQS